LAFSFEFQLSGFSVDGFPVFTFSVDRHSFGCFSFFLSHLFSVLPNRLAILCSQFKARTSLATPKALIRCRAHALFGFSKTILAIPNLARLHRLGGCKQAKCQRASKRRAMHIYFGTCASRHKVRPPAGGF
jgi:hypothetical protein